jgi:hypothetical protein
MPDSAVKSNLDALPDDTAAKNRRRRAADTPAMPDSADSADTEKKLARAARSAQRLAQLSEGARNGETLDLFAEDAERAQFQAMNTDIRQGTFEGFELPEVFLAAVQSNCGAASTGGGAPESTAAKRTSKASVASVEPVQGLFQDDAFEPRSGEIDAVGKPGAIAAAVPRSASISSVALHDNGGLARQDEPAPTPDHAPASALDEGLPYAKASAQNDAVPELDRARATAFADTIDALHAVLAEQRTSATAHARRMKTMLTVIVCAMLVTMATGIAQTVVLMRMSHDGKLQQDRTEQLMLNQQATLASLFDTDSATVSVRHEADARASDDASPVQPVSAVRPDPAPKKHAHQAHHRAGSTTH